METLLDVVELVFVVLTLVWVGKRPTVGKTALMIVCVWAVELAGFSVAASGQGMSVYDYGLQALDRSLDSMRNSVSADQQALFASMAGTLAGCVPGLYVISASARVFGLLCLRWVFDRVRRKSQWSAFSMLDLGIAWLAPLMAGIVLYIVSLVPGVPGRQTVFLLALNVLMASVVPLFVQGAAAGKGVMNRVHMRLAWQLVLGFFALVTATAFLVLPVIGLIDFWANFRKLPRDGQRPEQKRLPE